MVSSGASNRNDRRGFDVIIQLLIVGILVSLGIMVIYDWKVGLVCFVLCCIYLITAEAVSSRPDNNPFTFLKWRQRNVDNTEIANCPILLCLGDSLTHGNCSASYTPEIPYQLSLKLGLPVPSSDKHYAATFTEPIFVVNGGQNSITSHTVLHEKLIPYMNMIRPDYVFILIGTNDIQALCRPQLIGSFIRHVNRIPENPTLQKFEQNLRQMINYILNEDDNTQSSSSRNDTNYGNISPHVQLGICTLPPLGENLNSYSNQMIRQANGIIERLVAEKSTCPRITLIPLYQELEKVILQKQWKYSIPYDIWWWVAIIMNPIYHVSHGSLLSWNTMSYLMGNHVVMSDGIHLNETGRDILVQLLVNEFLYKKNITKAIAVKKFR